MPVVLVLVRLQIIAQLPPFNRISVIYGFILVWILQSFVGASLAEFVSAYPTEGGMYHWIAAIAPKRYNSLLSFATGWSTVFGCEISACRCRKLY
jgi:choline transport protein